MKKNMTLFVLLLCSVQLLHAQNVGIGTTTPQYKLDIAGSVHSNSNAYFDGYVGIGTTTPAYEFQVNNGPCCALQYNRFKSLVFLLQQRQ